jgi:UDP-N-acetylmuramoyl-tripeptide--D-alanyl-D-alanine ligase
MYLTMGEWAEACGGEILAGASGIFVGDENPGGLSIDTRKLTPGQWFIALTGKEGHDGHDHLAGAVAASAAGTGGVIVSDRSRYETDVKAAHPDLPALLVPDTTKALADAARGMLDKFNPFVIAITGTVGKTSVKEAVAHITSARWPTLKNPHNWNTEIGLPLAVFDLTAEHRVAVLECATRGIGQIRELSLIARPDIAVITAIGPGHLSEFGSIDAVARGKWEIIDGLKYDGVVVAPGDSPYTDEYGEDSLLATFGMDETDDVYPSKIEIGQFDTKCEIVTPVGCIETIIPSTSTGDIRNILCATACCIYMEINKDTNPERLSPDEIGEAIKTIPQIPGRSERIIRSNRVEVIFDAYNSNPLSLSNALEAFSRRTVHFDGTPVGRRVAVLGDMLELGTEEETFHVEAGKQVAGLPIDVLITVGRLALDIRNTAEQARGDRIPGSHFPTTVECASALPRMLKPGDLVLMKASRALGFEKLLEGDW